MRPKQTRVRSRPVHRARQPLRPDLDFFQDRDGKTGFFAKLTFKFHAFYFLGEYFHGFFGVRWKRCGKFAALVPVKSSGSPTSSATLPMTVQSLKSCVASMNNVTSHHVRPRRGLSLPPLGNPLVSVWKRDPGTNKKLRWQLTQNSPAQTCQSRAGT